MAGGWLWLSTPAWHTMANLGREGSTRRKVATAVFGVLGLGFWLGIYFTSQWFFGRCLQVEMVGALLVRKVMDMVFLVFMSVLLFSNLVAGFSTMYLADDLGLLFTLPVDVDSLYLSRLTQTSIHSSWMMLIFGLPVLVAAGTVFHAGAWYLVLVVAVLLPFLLLMSLTGTTITTILVMVFPARRARDLIGILGLIGFTVLFVMFRLMRPERLLDEREFQDMVSFLAAFETPGGRWLPSTWAVRILFPALAGDWHDGRWHMALLWTSAGAALAVATWFHRPLYRRAYSRALEGSDPRLGGRGRVAEVRPPRGAMVESIRKDLLAFLRDPSQWSQVLLLAAVVAVYVINFKNFELLGTTGIIGELGLFYLNMGLTGFVLAAMGARLVFPAVSLEGKAFWLLRTAPMTMDRLLTGKMLGGLVPLAAVGLVTIGVTDWMLGTSPVMVAASTGSVTLMAWMVSSMAAGLGAIYPRFDTADATRIAAGYGGIVYMVLTMSAILVVMAMQAWLVFLVHRSVVLGNMSFPITHWAGATALAIASLGAAWAFGRIPMVIGARSLEVG